MSRRFEPNQNFVPTQRTRHKWWVIPRPLGRLFTLDAASLQPLAELGLFRISLLRVHDA